MPGYTIEGADELMRKIQGLSPELRSMANRELRAASRQIAEGAAAELRGRGTGAAQARAVSATARPKSDRLPVVRIPGVKPGLSGIRRGAGMTVWRQLAQGAAGSGTAPQFAGTTFRWVSDRFTAFGERGRREWSEAMTATLRRWGLI